MILDNTEQKNYELAILEMAYTDMLTGLPNRASFDNYLKQKLLNPVANKGIGLAFIDLNDFKVINDTFGHSAGDKVLSAIGKRLKERAGTTNLAARIGGDEFCVVFETESFCERTVTDNFIRLGNDISREIEIDNFCINIGVSIGVVISSGNTSAEILLRNADKRHCCK